MHKDRKISNNKPEKIIRGNVCNFMLQYWWRWWYSPSLLKELNNIQYTVNCSVLRVYFVFCRMKKFWTSCWWYCSSTPIHMEHCCHLRPLRYRKSTWCAVWHISATDISHWGDLWWYHRLLNTEMCNRNLLQRFTRLLFGLSLLL